MNPSNPSNPNNPSNPSNPMNPSNPSKCILLTIDVEDWFQVENFKRYIPFSSWDSCELRVERNTHRILDLLDSINVPGHQLSTMSHELHNLPTASRLALNSKDSPCAMPHALCRSPKATFFVLGWIAKRLPQLVREIHSRGHEVASHGYNHFLCPDQNSVELKKDLIESKMLLEDIIGSRVYGYRAPSFSINDEVLKAIEDAGYFYDSSYNSFAMNKRYGRLNLNGNENDGNAIRIRENFYELPISNLRIGKRFLPWGGGGYFRMIPSGVFNRGARSILKKQSGYLFYLHPWEIDPTQPTVNDAKLLYRIRHYTNLKNTLTKLSNFLNHFKDCEFLTCHQYLAKIEKGGEFAKYSTATFQNCGM
jgi:polysaccharide deacetylase family protein (PEP-CTERM system associated)